MRRRLLWRATIVAVVIATWHFATVPWGLRMVQLIPFAAPGAIIGAGGAWAYSLGDEASMRWRRISWGALAGTFALPPFIAFLIGLVGGVSPPDLATLFVGGAWVTLLVSFTAAGVRAAVRTASSPARRGVMIARWRAMVERRTRRLRRARAVRRERRVAARNAVQP